MPHGVTRLQTRSTLFLARRCPSYLCESRIAASPRRRRSSHFRRWGAPEPSARLEAKILQRLTWTLPKMQVPVLLRLGITFKMPLVLDGGRQSFCKGALVPGRWPCCTQAVGESARLER